MSSGFLGVYRDVDVTTLPEVVILTLSSSLGYLRLTRPSCAKYDSPSSTALWHRGILALFVCLQRHKNLELSLSHPSCVCWALPRNMVIGSLFIDTIASLNIG